MRTTREILARYLPERIFENPFIKDCFIKAMEKMVIEKAPKELQRIGIDSWMVMESGRPRRGPRPYQWVKIGGEMYPQKWVFNRLLGIKESDSINQQYAEDFFKALGLETRD